MKSLLHHASRALLVGCVLAGAPAGATMWTVTPEGTGDFATIQAAVDFASDGDDILLGAGTFSGPGNFGIQMQGKLLTIRSAGGPATCVIDCGSSGIGFAFDWGEPVGSTLEGISIVNSTYSGQNLGAVSFRSGAGTLRDLVIEGAWLGVMAHYSSPVLENVEIRDGGAPAIDCYTGAPTITGCTIESNTAVFSGSTGAIRLLFADATIENCRIVGNDSGTAPRPLLRAGGIGVLHSSPLIRACVISGNTTSSGAVAAGGILVFGSFSSPTVESCTIASNRANWVGGIDAVASATVHLQSSIVWANCEQDLHVGMGATMEVGCSDVDTSGGVGPGTLILDPDVITTDPLFCGAIECGAAPSTSGIFTVHASSPAMNQSCGAMGALGSGCGAASAGARLEGASWASIKSRYR